MTGLSAQGEDAGGVDVLTLAGTSVGGRRFAAKRPVEEKQPLTQEDHCQTAKRLPASLQEFQGLTGLDERERAKIVSTKALPKN